MRDVLHLSTAMGYGGFLFHMQNFAERGDWSEAQIANAQLTDAETSLKALETHLARYRIDMPIAAIQVAMERYRQQLTALTAGRRADGADGHQQGLGVDLEAQQQLQALTKVLETREDSHVATHDRLIAEIETKFAWGSLIVLIVIASGVALSIFVVRLDTVHHTLQSALEEVDLLIEEAPDVILYVDGAGTIVRANKRINDLLGYEPREIVGRRAASLIPLEKPGPSRVYPTGSITGTLPTEAANGHPMNARTKDGRSVPVTISFNSVVSRGETMTVVAVRDATSERARQMALEEAREHAEQLSELKSAFLANMSHEIRTPLTGMLAVGDLLSQAQLTPEQQRHVQTLKRSGIHLLDILNDVLDLSKLEAGLLTFQEEPIELDHVTEGIESLFSGVAQTKGIGLSLTVTGPGPRPTVIGDAVRLKQILLNLVGNAVKFTQKGSVHVALTVDPAKIATGATFTAVVRDTGVGIPAEEIEAIFDPFAQVDQSRDRPTDGTGLGLAICRRLAKTMGGEITAVSEVGIGSTFTLTLPLGLHQGMASRTVRAADPSVEIDPDIRLLIVDDNDMNRRLVVDILNARGLHHLDIARDGQEALSKILASDYDAVLMDIRMPKLDGPAVLAELRATAPEKVRNIVAFTADAMVDRINEYKAMGFSGYVTKPINWGQLADALSAVGNAAEPAKVQRVVAAE